MGLEYKCLEGMIKPTIHIDEFSSKMGDDDDVAVASFYVTDEQAAQDLVAWFEKGYDFVLDADRSPGEIEPNKYLVYVEMKRRTNLPQNLKTLLDDMTTLCDIEPHQWTLKHGKKTFDFTPESFTMTVPLSPRAYRLDRELGLNKLRETAGLKTKPVYENDEAIQKLKDIAGI